MEAQLQTKTDKSYTISTEYFVLVEETDIPCPFCGQGMENIVAPILSCRNPICPYVLHEEVRDVVAALVETGRDELQAAQIAAKYSVDYAEADPVTRERFAVTDESSANWVLKKLAYIEARRAAAQGMVDREIESIRQRGQEITDPMDRQIEFFRAAFGEQLREFTEQTIVGQKTKSIKLLHGVLGFRSSPEKLVVEDEARAIEVVENNGYLDLVRIHKELSRSAVRARLKEYPDDAILGSVASLEPGENVFYIKAEMPGG